jgi:site-specific recombinase XerD
VIVGKGRGAGKRRRVPIADDFIPRWDAHCTLAVGREQYVFFSRPSRLEGGDPHQAVRRHELDLPMRPQGLRKLLLRLQEQSERRIPLAQRTSTRLTPHVLRRTYACLNVIAHELGIGGLDLVSLQRAMGHGRLDTTQVYLSDVGDYLNQIRRPLGAAVTAAAIVDYANGREGSDS